MIEMLDKINQKILKMTSEFDRIYNEVVKRLAYYNILLIGAQGVNDYQKSWLT